MEFSRGSHWYTDNSDPASKDSDKYLIRFEDSNLESEVSRLEYEMLLESRLRSGEFQLESEQA